MAGLLETWGSELVKLGRRKKSFVPAKFAGEESPVMKEKEASATRRIVRQRSSVSISEATMCLLMDRFAPS